MPRWPGRTSTCQRSARHSASLRLQALCRLLDPALRLRVASRAQPRARGPTCEEPEAADTCGLALSEPARAQQAPSSRSESLRTGLSRWRPSWSGFSPILSLRPRAPPERCFLTRRKLLKFLCPASVYTQLIFKAFLCSGPVDCSSGLSTSVLYRLCGGVEAFWSMTT